MGYGWPGRLRSSEALVLPRLACHSHLLRRRLSRLARQRSREGMDIYPSSNEVNKSLTSVDSGFLRFFTSAKGFLLSSSAAKAICDTILRRLKSLQRHRRNQLLRNRCGKNHHIYILFNTNGETGRGSPKEDWCLQVPRVLSQDQQWCSRSL